jgi:hypothetical protein
LELKHREETCGTTQNDVIQPGGKKPKKYDYCKIEETFLPSTHIQTSLINYHPEVFFAVK